MTKPALLMTGPMMPLIEAGLEPQFAIHRLWTTGDRDALLAQVGGEIEAVCTGGHTGVKMDDAMMARLPRLKVIANFGVGYDSIDAAAAAKRGVIVTNTPDVLTEEVADTALGLLLMTVRELSKAEQYLRAGRWAREGDYRLTPASLRDRTVGIAGLGRIGKAIARRCEAFGMAVSYYGRSRQPDVSYAHYSTLDALAQAVDTLFIVTPGGAATQKLVDQRVLEALGPRGILVNIARGSVIDEDALIAALKEGRILAAGLDVFINEPRLREDFLSLDNVVLLPHVGSGSQHTRNLMGQLVVDNLVAYSKRDMPPNAVAETPFKSW